jgi:hypothetical protein
MNITHFADVNFIHRESEHDALLNLYNGLTKQIRTKQSNWEFVTGRHVGPNIKIYNRGTRKIEAKQGLQLTSLQQGLNTAISEKNMAYQTGRYYFEFIVKDVGQYSNFLVGVCFKSIDGQFRSEYDAPMTSEYMGSQKSQYGVYLDGGIWTNRGGVSSRNSI